VNRELSVHAKGRQAVTLPTYRRVTLSVNDEPENLMILPPMDASITDKVILVRCSPARTHEDRAKNWSELTSQLPALAHQLETWKLPADMRCGRFGVRAKHDPVLLSVLTGLSPEARLLALIDEVIFADRAPLHGPWTGTADELERTLRTSQFGFACEKLLYFTGATGTYLGRIAARFPARVSAMTDGTRTRWVIRGP
jgi:hypothetical protein